MSQNLYASVDSEDLILYQTPTWITEVCLMGPCGLGLEYTNHRLSGDEAKRAIQIYQRWVKERFLDNPGQSLRDDKQYVATVRRHLRGIKTALKKGKDFSVWTI